MSLCSDPAAIFVNNLLPVAAGIAIVYDKGIAPFTWAPDVYVILVLAHMHYFCHPKEKERKEKRHRKVFFWVCFFLAGIAENVLVTVLFDQRRPHGHPG